MKYEIEFKPRSLKDCKKIPKEDLQRIFAGIEDLKDELKGDVKHLTNYSPEYRLRIGNYRILFELEDDKIVIYRMRHRQSVYR